MDNDTPALLKAIYDIDEVMQHLNHVETNYMFDHFSKAAKNSDELISLLTKLHRFLELQLADDQLTDEQAKEEQKSILKSIM